MDTRERWEEEARSAWLYAQLARAERDPRRRALFEALGVAAAHQASLVEAEAGRSFGEVSPRLRGRLVALLARTLGTQVVRPFLAALKIRGLSAWDAPILGHPHPILPPSEDARGHHGRSSGTLRAAVFGMNDGVVSNTALVLGVVGAGMEPGAAIATGVAGLLAGAFSMAAGEYVSVASQRELYEFQVAEEEDELARYPAAEAEELAVIYAARGVPLDVARASAQALVADPARALDALVREELGLDPRNLGSPAWAALASFASFAVGAGLPLVPLAAGRGIGWTLAAAGTGLFVVGAVIALFSGRSALLGGARMLAIGGLAGAATYTAGTLVGGVL